MSRDKDPLYFESPEEFAEGGGSGSSVAVAMPHHLDRSVAVFGIVARPERDIASWAFCLDTVRRCYDRGRGTFDECVIQAGEFDRCPLACVRHYAVESAEAVELGDFLRAFEAVFVAPGGLCVPSDEGAPNPGVQP